MAEATARSKPIPIYTALDRGAELDRSYMISWATDNNRECLRIVYGSGKQISLSVEDTTTKPVLVNIVKPNLIYLAHDIAEKLEDFSQMVHTHLSLDYPDVDHTRAVVQGIMAKSNAKFRAALEAPYSKKVFQESTGTFLFESSDVEG